MMDDSSVVLQTLKLFFLIEIEVFNLICIPANRYCKYTCVLH
jgi:hypothetical protein